MKSFSSLTNHHHHCLHSTSLLESSTRVATLYTIMHTLVHLIPMLPLIIGMTAISHHGHAHGHVSISHVGELLTGVVFLNLVLHIMMFLFIVAYERMKINN